MKSRTTLPLVTAGLGIIVLAVACIAGRDKFVEQWYLWKLKSGDMDDQRAAAAALVAMGSRAAEGWYLRALESGFEDDQRTAVRQLGEMRSVAAVPALLDLSLRRT